MNVPPVELFNSSEKPAVAGGRERQQSARGDRPLLIPGAWEARARYSRYSHNEGRRFTCAACRSGIGGRSRAARTRARGRWRPEPAPRRRSTAKLAGEALASVRRSNPILVIRFRRHHASRLELFSSCPAELRRIRLEARL